MRSYIKGREGYVHFISNVKSMVWLFRSLFWIPIFVVLSFTVLARYPCTFLAIAYLSKRVICGLFFYNQLLYFHTIMPLCVCTNEVKWAESQRFKAMPLITSHSLASMGVTPCSADSSTRKNDQSSIWKKLFSSLKEDFLHIKYDLLCFCVM